MLCCCCLIALVLHAGLDVVANSFGLSLKTGDAVLQLFPLCVCVVVLDFDRTVPNVTCTRMTVNVSDRCYTGPAL